MHIYIYNNEGNGVLVKLSSFILLPLLSYTLLLTCCSQPFGLGISLTVKNLVVQENPFQVKSNSGLQSHFPANLTLSSILHE